MIAPDREGFLSAIQRVLHRDEPRDHRIVFEVDPTRRKTIICPHEDTTTIVQGLVQQFGMKDYFLVVTSANVPHDQIHIITTPNFLGDQTEGTEMGIVKHGEGEVLPENEGQKTASQGMSAEAAAELAQENEVADGATDGSAD